MRNLPWPIRLILLVLLVPGAAAAGEALTAKAATESAGVHPRPGPSGDARMRAGELGVRGVEQPFAFAGWLSPIRFAIRYGDAGLEIERAGRGRYELVAVARLP